MRSVNRNSLHSMICRVARATLISPSDRIPMNEAAIQELKKIGETFRSRREEKNLTLREVENSTSIRSNYLQAIENGEVNHFLSHVYYLGFVRQYAVFLGIDVETLMREHTNAFKLKGDQHDFAYGIGTLEKRGSMNGGVKWLPNLIWALFGGAVLFAAYYFARFLGVI